MSAREDRLGSDDEILERLANMKTPLREKGVENLRRLTQRCRIVVEMVPSEFTESNPKVKAFLVKQLKRENFDALCIEDTVLKRNDCLIQIACTKKSVIHLTVKRDQNTLGSAESRLTFWHFIAQMAYLGMPSQYDDPLMLIWLAMSKL